MQTKRTLVSIVAAAVLAMPVIASAARVPGSTDDARAAAGAAVASSRSSVSTTHVGRAASTDEARALAGKRTPAPMQVACSIAVAAPLSTDAVRPGLGLSAEACARAA